MGKADKTLAAVFEEPTRANVAWKDIESLLEHLGAAKFEGSGSRVRFMLNGVGAIFHRPHPGKEAGKGMVERVRDFLVAARVLP